MRYVMIKCDYCGRENQDETAPCPGCGTPPRPDEPEGEPGRPVPVTSWVDFAVAVASIAAGHVGGFIHLINGASKLESPNSPHRLLERAALLESVDMRQAIALYEQIILKHPGTGEAKEAIRNIQTLRAAHAELQDMLVEQN